jgi:plasmid stabilization system protein ParE
MLPVVYTPRAEKYFKKIKEEGLANTFRDAITRIRQNPNIGEQKTGDLSGIWCLDVYYKKTNYELAYRITRLDSGDIVVVIMAGTRENFYRELKQYLK